MADEELTVDFELFGVPKGLALIDQVSKALARLPDRVVVMVDVVYGPGMKRLASAGGPLGSGNSRIGGARSSTSATPAIPGGPFSSQQLNQQYQLWRAQRAQARAMQQMQTNPFQLGPKPQTFSQALKNAIFSTRFTAENGHVHLAPLIGRTAQALGKLGPLGVAAGVVTAGLLVMHEAVDHASKLLNNLQSARYTGGGSYADTGRAAGLGAALGMGAGDVAAMAREFGQNLATNGQAAAFGSKYGIRDPFGENQFGGDTNKFKEFFKAADVIANIPNEQEAIRAARAFGPNMEKLLGLRDLSPEHRREALNSMQEMFGPEQARSAAEYRFATGKLSMAFDKLLIATTPLIDAFASVVGWVADKLSHGGDPSFLGPGFGQGGEFKAQKDANKKAAEAKDKNAAALDANTEALYAQARAMRAIFGGDERARGAMPANMRGVVFEQGMKAHAIGLGAFGV